MTVRLTWYRNGVYVHSPGSNFWFGGHTLPAEHEFQARKTHDLDWQVRILCAANEKGQPDPDKAKRLGREAPLRPDWERVKLNEMRSVIVRKALAEPVFVEWLLDTGEDEIVHINTWHDNYWGDCECKRCEDTSGQNQLGRILMEVREIVREYES